MAVALFRVTHPTPTTLLQTGGAKFKLAREHLGESKGKSLKETLKLGKDTEDSPGRYYSMSCAMLNCAPFYVVH